MVGQTAVALLRTSGALGCALAVALGAYASHAAAPGQAPRLALAALVLFGHGLVLYLLAPAQAQRPGPLRLMLAGTVLFSGSLLVAAGFDAGAPLAPAGGLALIVAWLWLAGRAFRP